MSNFCYTITRYRDANSEYHVEDKAGRTEVDIDLVDVGYDGHWEDFGIGAYEYWGFKGVDRQMGFVVDDVDYAKDDKGEDWLDRLTEEEREGLEQYCSEQEVYDPRDYDDRDDDRY